MKRPLILIASGLGMIAAAQIIGPMTVGIRFTFFFATFCGAVLTVYGGLDWLHCQKRWPRFALWGKRIILGGVCLFLVSFVAVEGMILRGGRSDDVTGRETLVILGAGVHGETPSLTLLSRLEKAVDFLEEHPQTEAILCGGQGPGEAITEALAMERYLLNAGIAPERLQKEEASSDTVQNLRNAKALLQREGKSGEIIILTNDFHLWRAKLIARRWDIQAVGLAAPTPPVLFLRPNYYLREYFSVLIFWIEGMGITLDTSLIGM